MGREDVRIRRVLGSQRELWGAGGGGRTSMGRRDIAGGRNMDREAGHEPGGNILRYETRRINTGW